MKTRPYRIRWSGPDGVQTSTIEAVHQEAAVNKLRESYTVHEVLRALPQGVTPEDAGKILHGPYERDL